MDRFEEYVIIPSASTHFKGFIISAQTVEILSTNLTSSPSPISTTVTRLGGAPPRQGYSKLYWDEGHIETQLPAKVIIDQPLQLLE